MGWILLLLGVGLWSGVHLLKRVAPERRAALEPQGHGKIAALLVLSILLMILGYRWTPFVAVWAPPAFFTHINNLLILVAFYLMSPAPKKGRFLTGMRHPMLTGFALWALAHLLVNGELASVILFGGLLAWSIGAMVAINRAQPDWTPPARGAIKWDLMGFAGAVILVGVIGYVHGLIGPWPFG